MQPGEQGAVHRGTHAVEELRADQSVLCETHGYMTALVRKPVGLGCYRSPHQIVRSFATV